MITRVEASIIVPCLNEARYIGVCLQSIIDCDYPKDLMEVLVVDGGSSDGSQKIVEDYSRRYPAIRLIDNPARIMSAGMNVGIRNARGRFIVKMDAHCIYDPHYISTCIKYLVEHDAHVTGGVLKAVPREDTATGRAIAYAISHPFGSGNSYFRIGSDETRWVDAVAFGCYEKDVIERIGLYDEELHRSSDSDLSVRLKKEGCRILLVPSAVGYYYTLSRLGEFWSHNFTDGFWATYPLKFGKRIFSWRHLVPLAFVSGVAALAALAPLSTLFLWMLFGALGAYFLMASWFSIGIAQKEGRLTLVFLVLSAFAIRHFGYGLGSIAGVVRASPSARFWKQFLPT